MVTETGRRAQLRGRATADLARHARLAESGLRHGGHRLLEDQRGAPDDAEEGVLLPCGELAGAGVVEDVLELGRQGRAGQTELGFGGEPGRDEEPGETDVERGSQL